MIMNHDHQPQMFAFCENLPFVANTNPPRLANNEKENILSNHSSDENINSRKDESGWTSSQGNTHNQKRKFSPEEDAILKREIALHGAKKWDQIALSLPGRSGRQCRDRFHNYLNPSLINGPWTREEDRILEQKVYEIGQHWNKITKFFRGRSTNNVKNRWYTYICKQNRGNCKTLSGKNSNKNRQHAVYQVNEESNKIQNIERNKKKSVSDNNSNNSINNISVLNNNKYPMKSSYDTCINISEILNEDIVVPKSKNINKVFFPPIYPPNRDSIFPSNLGLFDFLSQEIGA